MSNSDDQVAAAYLSECCDQMHKKAERIRHCVDQLSEEQAWWRPRDSANSIGNLILHLCGNIQQWIIHGVGGEPDSRNRPAEFTERGPLPKAELLRQLEETIERACGKLAGVSSQQLLASRRIQGFDATGMSAVFDSVSHLAGHAQEIIYITRLQIGDAYQFQWQPSTPEEGAAPS